MILSEIITAKKAIDELSNNKEMDFNVAYCLVKLNSELEKDYTFFVSEFNKLLDKYAKKNDSGEIITEEYGITISQENIDLFNQKEKELESVEVEAPKTTIPISYLTPLKLSMAQVSAILPFIDDMK